MVVVNNITINNIPDNAEWVNFTLKNHALGNLNVQSSATEVIVRVQDFGGTYVLVFEDGYSFLWNQEEAFDDGKARRLGAIVASIPAFKKHVKYYPENYSKGGSGVSGQLFERVR